MDKNVRVLDNITLIAKTTIYESQTSGIGYMYGTVIGLLCKASISIFFLFQLKENLINISFMRQLLGYDAKSMFSNHHNCILARKLLCRCSDC